MSTFVCTIRSWSSATSSGRPARSPQAVAVCGCPSGRALHHGGHRRFVSLLYRMTEEDEAQLRADWEERWRPDLVAACRVPQWPPRRFCRSPKEAHSRARRWASTRLVCRRAYRAVLLARLVPRTRGAQLRCRDEGSSISRGARLAMPLPPIHYATPATRSTVSQSGEVRF